LNATTVHLPRMQACLSGSGLAGVNGTSEESQTWRRPSEGWIIGPGEGFPERLARQLSEHPGFPGNQDSNWGLSLTGILGIGRTVPGFPKAATWKGKGAPKRRELGPGEGPGIPSGSRWAWGIPRETKPPRGKTSPIWGGLKGFPPGKVLLTKGSFPNLPFLDHFRVFPFPRGPKQLWGENPRRLLGAPGVNFLKGPPRDILGQGRPQINRGGKGPHKPFGETHRAFWGASSPEFSNQKAGAPLKLWGAQGPSQKGLGGNPPF